MRQGAAGRELREAATADALISRRGQDAAARSVALAVDRQGSDEQADAAGFLDQELRWARRVHQDLEQWLLEAAASLQDAEARACLGSPACSEWPRLEAAESGAVRREQEIRVRPSARVLLVRPAEPMDSAAGATAQTESRSVAEAAADADRK